MKQVVIRPERCVGCMQCMVACGVAHSKSKNLYEAVLEEVLPRPRIHIGYAGGGKSFPNRCRHCDPTPCMSACFPGAIYREEDDFTVLIEYGRCIRCGSCVMACPFGVIRFYPSIETKDRRVPQKCDNCLERQREGKIPACVEACKTGALSWEDLNESLRKRTKEVARSVATGFEDIKRGLFPTWANYLELFENSENVGNLA